MVYSDIGFCKGFILVWHKDPEYLKKSLWGVWKERLLLSGELGWTFQHGLAQGSLARSLLRLEMAGRTCRLGAGGEGFAVGYFGKGGKLLGSLKDLILNIASMQKDT